MTRPDPAERATLDALDDALAGEPVDAAHADLPRLVGAVRADAPRMSPAFARRLEAIASRPGPATRRLPRWSSGPSRLAVAGALATLLLGVVAVVGVLRSGGADGDSASVSSSGSSSAPARAPSELSLPGGAPARGSGGVAPQTRVVERITSVALTAPAAKLGSVSDDVIATADRFDAIVQRSNVALDDADGGSASFDLRVPTGRLSDALAALSKLAHVASRTESSLDITAPTRTVADRLADARSRRASLLRRLATATTDNETASLRARLRDARARVATFETQRRRLAVRGDFARVDVTLSATRHGDGHDGATGGGPWTPGDAWRAARSILAVAAAVAVLLATLAAPVALLGALAVGVRRRRRSAGLSLL